MTWDRDKRRGDQHGTAHARERRRRAELHQPTDPCTRCGRSLGEMGPWLHLDHDDHDKTVWLGFAHARCNVRAGSDRGREVQRARRRGDDGAAGFTRGDW